MKKIVARTLKDEALHKNRRQISSSQAKRQTCENNASNGGERDGCEKVFDFMKLVVQLN